MQQPTASDGASSMLEKHRKRKRSYCDRAPVSTVELDSPSAQYGPHVRHTAVSFGNGSVRTEAASLQLMRPLDTMPMQYSVHGSVVLQEASEPVVLQEASEACMPILKL